MAALTADRATRVRASDAQRTRIGDVAAAVIIFRGALIAKNAGGYIVPAADTAALKVVGVSEQHVDNSAGANGALTVTYTTGLDVELNNAGGAIVQASKHAACYVSDDQSVTTAAVAAQDVIAGVVTEFTTTKVWVHVDEDIGVATGAITPLDGSDMDTVADGAVSPASLVSGVVEVIPITIPDAATQTYVYSNAEKWELVDVTVLKDGANVAGTIQITDSADAAITNAIAADTNKAVTRAGTIDVAKRVLAAAAGFKIIATRAGVKMTCLVLLHVIKRA